jgi:hypothetical protein
VVVFVFGSCRCERRRGGPVVLMASLVSCGGTLRPRRADERRPSWWLSCVVVCALAVGDELKRHCEVDICDSVGEGDGELRCFVVIGDPLGMMRLGVKVLAATGGAEGLFRLVPSMLTYELSYILNLRSTPESHDLVGVYSMGG